MLNRIVRRSSGPALVAVSALLALAACDEELDEPFEVEGAGDISGTLFYDVDRDGDFDPFAGDSALRNVRVYVLERGDPDTTNAIATTTTNTQGRFEFDALPVGTHDLYVLLPTGLTGVVCQNPLPVSVRINETTNVEQSAQLSCLITIAAARELALVTPPDEVVTVRGVVTVGTGDLSSSYYFVQDETGGIKVAFSGNAEAGDFVEVTGETELFSGAEAEILDGTTTLLGTAPLPDPIEITGAELLSHDYQGSLVTVRGVEVTAVPAIPDQTGVSYNVNVVAPDDKAFIIRVDSDANITPGTFVVGNTYDVTGVLSPFGGAEQLYVRFDEDITPVP